jgi:hypothetical protein
MREERWWSFLVGLSALHEEVPEANRRRKALARPAASRPEIPSGIMEIADDVID